MVKSTGKNKIETVFVLVIFSVFALSVLMVLMLGASVYKNMTEISRAGQDERTVLSFIWTKVKNGDKAGNVYVGEFCGLPALCFDEDYSGVTYRTVIYYIETCWVRGDDWDNRFSEEEWKERAIDYNMDDWIQYEAGLYELFSDEGLGLKPTDGTEIMKIGNVIFEEVEYGMIRVSTGERSLLLSPRGNKTDIGSDIMIFN